MNPYDVFENIGTLIAHGADIDNIVHNMDFNDVVEIFDILMDHGADIDNIVSKLPRYIIERDREKLLAYGANL